MSRYHELCAEISKLVPGVQSGMFVTDCLELIAAEIKRLKVIAGESI